MQKQTQIDSMCLNSKSIGRISDRIKVENRVASSASFSSATLESGRSFSNLAEVKEKLLYFPRFQGMPRVRRSCCGTGG